MTAFLARQLRFSGVLDAAAGLILILATLGFLGRAYWLFDLCAHFRLQYIAGLVALGIVFVVLRKRVRAGICLLAAALLAAPVVPYFLPRSSSASPPELKIVSYNINTANPNRDAVRDELLAQDADVIFLMEVNDSWMDHLTALRNSYPYQMTESRPDNFGVAVFSRLPFGTSKVTPFTEYELPAVEFSVTKDGITYTIIGVHTLPPVTAEYSAARDAQLREIVRETQIPHRVVIGDFNLTPFSPHFSAMLRGSGLRDSAIGFGLYPTWLSNHPLFAIPIDHALISDDLKVCRRELGASHGSDHRPLILEIAPKDR